MKTPNLRHLLAALEVSETGAISKAAKRIHLSQSAVTQAISRLEKSLETALFDRTTTGVLTTEPGKILTRRIARGYQWLRAIEQTVAAPGPLPNRHIARLLTVSQLRSLIAVVDCGSYTRAAHRLGLSQPTVHRTVRELETLCHQQFFQRSPQGVVPSWQARQIARCASLFLAEIQQGLVELEEHKGIMRGTVAIGALPFSRTRLVPRAVTRLLERYPQTKIKIVDGPYEEQLTALLHGQLDLIVGALRSPQPSPDIVQELLFSDPLSIVVRPGHHLAGSKKISAEKLSQLRWIAPRENTPARAVFSQFFHKERLEPPTDVIECSSLVAIRGLLLESDRAALLPAKQVAVDVDAGLLAVSPLPLAGTSRDIGITLRKDWQPTRIQNHLLQLLTECAEA